MDGSLAGILALVALLFLLASGISIAFAMGIIAFIGFWLVSGFDVALGVLYNIPFTGFYNWMLCVIPLFVLMGNFAFYCGLTSTLFDAASKWLGRIPGGLGVATIVASGGFGAATGAGVATAASMTMIAVPEMEKHGYQRKMAFGTVASGATLASIIPPSIGLVVYGMLTDTSIARLLIGGVMPGILLIILLSASVMLRVVRNPDLAKRTEQVPFSEKLSSLRGVWGIIVLIFCVLGTLYTGLATPTEAAGAGAAGALLLALASKGLDKNNFMRSLYDAGRMTCMIMFILVCGGMFSRFLTITGLPKEVALLIEGLNLHPVLILSVVSLVILFMGMFLDPMSIAVISLPVIFPVVVSLGYDPVWFGCYFTIFGGLGQVTPPIGLICFAMKGSIPNSTIEEIFAGTVPFIIVEFVGLAILVAFPQIILFLPNLMMGGG
jgi:C4-dicarboxylate transporter DctM subunit